MRQNYIWVIFFLSLYFLSYKVASLKISVAYSVYVERNTPIFKDNLPTFQQSYCYQGVFVIYYAGVIQTKI